MIGGENVSIVGYYKNNELNIKRTVLSGAALVVSAVSSVRGAVDSNVSDGVTLGGTVINSGLSAWMSPPLSYVLGITLFMMGFYAVAGLIKGRRRGKG
ncbi:Uncharacterised protein [uncultured archaeon]|nr:Uncharacterised protein [uncultured archaeon]